MLNQRAKWRVTEFLGALLLMGVFCLQALADEDDELIQTASDIHERVIVLDTHVDFPFGYETPVADPNHHDELQVDLSKMSEGQVDAVFFVVFVPQTERSVENYETARAQAQSKFDAIRRMAIDQYSDEIELAVSASDVRGLHEVGKKAALIGIENGFAMGDNPELVRAYYDLGARYMSLTHNGHNDLADSSAISSELGDMEAEHGGVSALGKSVVAQMNRLGIMVDVAHAAKSTVLELAEVSKAPIISSHHALKQFVDIPRNLDDEELLAIKETGGVVQIVAFDSYIKTVDPEKLAARRDLAGQYGIDSFEAFRAMSDDVRAVYMVERNKLDEQWPRASVADFVDHIDYAVTLIGIDHVGISSDFGGGGGIAGWDDASQSLNVTIELVRRGYTEPQIEKLWGGNLLRVMEEVERVAQKLQAE